MKLSGLSNIVVELFDTIGYVALKVFGITMMIALTTAVLLVTKKIIEEFWDGE